MLAGLIIDSMGQSGRWSGKNKNSYTIIDDLICTNDLILAELVPLLYLQEKDDFIQALMALKRYEIRIDWPQVIQIQVSNI